MKFDPFNKKKIAALQSELRNVRDTERRLFDDKRELELKLEKLEKEFERYEMQAKVKFTCNRVASERWGCQYRASLDFDLDEYRDCPTILRHVGENLIRMALSKCNQWEILRTK